MKKQELDFWISKGFFVSWKSAGLTSDILGRPMLVPDLNEGMGPFGIPMIVIQLPLI